MATASELTKQVMDEMYKGLPPSRIDKVLGLREGDAHDIVVAEWLRDKLRGARNYYD